MRRQYELMQMENNENMAEFFNRIITHTNGMKACGELHSDTYTLNPKFDHIVVVIEESKKLEDSKIEELQESLEEHEQRLHERSVEKTTENQALWTQVSRKGNNSARGAYNGWSRGRDSRNGSNRNSQSQGQIKLEQDQAGSSNRRGYNSLRRSKKKFDKKRVKCFKCNRIGNYSNECEAVTIHTNHITDQPNNGHQAHMAKEDIGANLEQQPILLMMTINQGIDSSEVWYVDSGCSNHMTGYKDWFVDVDESKKSRVSFVDNRYIIAEGQGKVLIRRNDGGSAII
ncbi:PREDICTED: uncharacterized protein LOC109356292 [Lupinus angustifolius]|uniref:uncharacterized protein LOC109356292 n=1 Tax=Lupinus angustifolius TaxID=3871 RepID=UPI00092F384E|nr:PREDICTED: uncharacterized protein LOC109356292 [Lupinus angustifolius]